MPTEQPERQFAAFGAGSEADSGALARERKLAIRLAAVAEAAVEAARQLDPDRLVADVPGLIVGAFGHYLANIFLIDRGDGALVLRASAGYPEPNPVPIGDRMPAGSGICGRVAETGEVYLARDVLTDPYYVQGPLLSGTRSELAAPIVAREGVIGVLDVQSREPDAFDDADAVALQALAAAVGVAIENARLFRRTRAHEQRLRAIIEAVPSPLGVYDAGGRLAFANAALLAIPGLVAAGPSGASPHAQEAGATAGGNHTDEPSDADEIRLDDPPRIYVRRVTPISLDPAGGPGGGDEGQVVLFLDVTNERAAVRAKDQVLSIAAHELRTPLTSLLGYLDLLLTQTARDQPALATIHQRLAKVRHEGGQLAWLVEQLLGLARTDAGTIPLRPTEVDARAVLERLAERFMVGAGYMGRIRVEAPATPVICRWDEERVIQILSNLLDNALKYAPDESMVVIAVAPPVDDRVRLEVRDQGPGISAEDLDRLFQPFSRAGAGANSGGLGLGLYVSRSLAERLGGRLWLESVPDVGTTAVLELPVRLGEASG